MSFKHIFGKVPLFLAGIVTLLTSSLPASALEGRWIQHPSACLRTTYKEGQVDRIIDGNRYVYFSVRGAMFTRSNNYIYSTINNVDPLYLFRYDKTAAWGKGSIRAVAQDVETSGAQHVALNYSPKWGVMAVAYENNKIDFIFDDGRVVVSQVLASTTMPKFPMTPYSFVFDEDKPVAYVSGGFGYAALNMESGDIEDFQSFGKAVSWAGRVGDNMVVFAGTMSPTSYSTSGYIFPVGEAPKSLDSPFVGSANLQYLMPLTSNTFAALAPGSADTQKTLRLYTISGSGVTPTDLVTGSTVDNGASTAYRHMFSCDGFASPSKNGYLISNNANLLLLKKGVDTSASSSVAADLIDPISKNGLTANEKNAKVASFDGSRVWFYTYESTGLDASARGFYSRDVSGTSWGDKSEVVRPNGPTSSVATYAAWHPELGLLVRGPGIYFREGTPDRDYFSRLKDGVWEDITYAANNSKYELMAKGAKDIGIDPLNPNWIWGCAHNYCLFRMDLEDYSNFVGLGTNATASYPNSYPGFIPMFEWQSAYKTLVNFSNVDFDNNNVMWTSRFWLRDDNMYDYEDALNQYVPLYYFTPEERIAMNEGTYTPVKHEIRVPRAYSQQTAILLAMKHKANESYIMGLPHLDYNDMRRVFIYDHSGTLEDTSDDRHVFLDDLRDENGEFLKIHEDKSVFEDPETGEIWLGTDIGLIIFNPSDLLEGKKIARRMHISRREGMAVDENPFEQIQVNSIADDIFGRRWLATDEGLYCLSPDREEILGHFTVVNSPLPSDEIFKVVTNGSNGVVYVLTSRGLAEFQPEGSMVALPANASLNIWPSAVTPDYKGYVNISGAEEGSVYEVCDASGNVVASLGKPSSGRLQWHPVAADGERVEPGKYNIRRHNTDEVNPVIILDK